MSCLWFYMPSYPWSSIVIIYGFPPPPSPLPPTFHMNPIRTTVPLVPSPNKTFTTPSYLPPPPPPVPIYSPYSPKHSTPSWCSIEFPDSCCWIGPGLFPGNLTGPILPPVHIHLYYTGWTPYPLIYGPTPCSSVASNFCLIYNFMYLTWSITPFYLVH